MIWSMIVGLLIGAVAGAITKTWDVSLRCLRA